jgi:hypothetical protein
MSIGGFLAKLCGPRVAGVPTLAISRLPLGGIPLGTFETKSHLDVGPMGSHKVYYKGEGGASLAITKYFFIV